METITQWIQANPILDFVILVGLPSVIQVSKININPWSWLGKQVGKCINGEVIERLDAVDKRMDSLEKRQFREENERLKRDTDLCRTRILRASDELRRGNMFSEEMFVQTLQDVTDYCNFCDSHPNYANDRAKAAIEKIKKTYQKCVDENSFL